VLGEVVDTCEALEAAVAGVDPALLTGEDAADLAERLSSTVKRCQAAVAGLAARAAECHSHRRRGYSTAAGWLAAASGTSHSDAHRALVAARRLAVDPGAAATAAAVAAGEVSIAEAAEIVAGEKAAPGSQETLLGVAKDPKAGLGRLREEARRLALQAMDPDERHRRQVAGRHARFWTDSTGMGRGEFALPPEVAAAVETRVGVEADRLYDAARRAAKVDGGEAPSWAACAADALAALIRGEPTTAGGGRGYPEVIFVVDAAAYQRGYPEPCEVSQILGGGPVPVTVIQQAAVGAFIKGVLHDGTDILAVKHWGRRRPAELQTALNLGAPPLFPGVACADCGRRWGIQWDHVEPLAHHGATQYTNLQPRCWPCHQAKTERDRAAGLLKPNPTTGPAGPSDRDHPGGPDPPGEASQPKATRPPTRRPRPRPRPSPRSPRQPAPATTAANPSGDLP